MTSSPKVTLFPWDPKSEAHRKCLVKQRVECGWHHEQVETTWATQQLEGKKCIYWIVLQSDESQATSPEGEEVLRDTATTINAVQRQPTTENFLPIGHISLDSKNPEAERIELDLPTQNVFWIKSFYVRESTRGNGSGRAAMDEVEAMAAQEPLLAKTLMLDTVQKDDQKREDFAKAMFGAVSKFTNEEWYSRRGYRLIKTVQNYYEVADKYGKIWDIKTVFMRKDIAGEEISTSAS